MSTSCQSPKRTGCAPVASNAGNGLGSSYEVNGPTLSWRDSERRREGETHRQTDRQRERQRQRETEAERDTKRQRDRERQRGIERQTERL